LKVTIWLTSRIIDDFLNVLVLRKIINICNIFCNFLVQSLTLNFINFIWFCQLLRLMAIKIAVIGIESITLLNQSTWINQFGFNVFNIIILISFLIILPFYRVEWPASWPIHFFLLFSSSFLKSWLELLPSVASLTSFVHFMMFASLTKWLEVRGILMWWILSLKPVIERLLIVSAITLESHLSLKVVFPHSNYVLPDWWSHLAWH
jgi:hypothetical protein